MTQPALHGAIRDDPENDSPRLAFADWLEANGQSDRAEWVRASCEFAKYHSNEPEWLPLLHRVNDSFQRCKPAWWQEITGVDQRNDRGMFRFILGASRSSRSVQPIKRLGKAAWLGQAFDEGWLQRIELWWDDGDAGPVVKAWKEPAARMPLMVRPSPQIGDEALRLLLRLPQLEALDLLTAVLRKPAAKELTGCASLRELNLELRLLDDVTVDALLDQVAAMANLRRLHLKGHDRIEYSARPNDADLLRLGAVAGLKRITLSDAPAVSDEGIGVVRLAHTSMAVVRG